jgi:hypothetical protein
MKNFLTAKEEQPTWWLIVKLIILALVLVVSIRKIQDEGTNFESVLLIAAALVIAAENCFYLYRKSTHKN